MIFTIKDQMVRDGQTCDKQHCPSALSMTAAGVWLPSVHYSIVSGCIEGNYYQGTTPDVLAEFMAQFDSPLGRADLLAKDHIEDIVWEVADEVFLTKMQCVKGCMKWYDVSLADVRDLRQRGELATSCAFCETVNPLLPWEDDPLRTWQEN